MNSTLRISIGADYVSLAQIGSRDPSLPTKHTRHTAVYDIERVSTIEILFSTCSRANDVAGAKCQSIGSLPFIFRGWNCHHAESRLPFRASTTTHTQLPQAILRYVESPCHTGYLELSTLPVLHLLSSKSAGENIRNISWLKRSPFLTELTLTSAPCVFGWHHLPMSA